MAGILYIVATPMGNLEDMTFRAVRILKEVDLIAAEDTRHSKRLMDHYGIQTPMVACHDHNEDRKAADLLARLASGQSIALISDAGTPLISDPGYKLVRMVTQHNITVVPVPGCNAAIAGLSAAGLPTDRFLFCGFLPKKQARQSRLLSELKPQSPTLIFYESPRRIKTLLARAADALGNRQACLARELTKRHEEFIRGSLSDILKALEQREQVKGECVLFIQGAAREDNPPPSAETLESAILEKLDQQPRTGDLAKELAATFNLPKKQVYDTILSLKRRTL